MKTDKIAAGLLLTLFIAGLAFGLFLTITGHGISSEAAGQGGGGLAMLFGWALAGMGYFVLGVAVIGAGIPWIVVTIKSRDDQQRAPENDDSATIHAENSESNNPRSTLDPNQDPKV